MMAILFFLFVLLFVVGLALAVWGVVSSRGGRARTRLDERLARGEISVSEHREIADALGPRPLRAVGIIALVLVAAGLVGLLAVGSTAPVGMWDRMRDMMGGNGMMGGGMMTDGRTERSAPEPQEGADDETVVGGEFYFRPDEIRIPAGETVNIRLENRGDAFHTLTVEELDFDLRAAAGDEIAGALEVPEAGSYRFICTVPGHAQAGMVGTLTVS